MKYKIVRISAIRTDLESPIIDLPEGTIVVHHEHDFAMSSKDGSLTAPEIWHFTCLVPVKE
jgi:hypothetical protein